MTVSAKDGRVVAQARARWRLLGSRWTWIVATSTVAATAAVLGGLSPVVRAPLVTWVVLCCPAIGFGRRSRSSDLLARGVMGSLGAVGSATVVAEALLLGHLWSPVALLVAMGGLATVLVSHRPAREARREP